MQSIYYRSGATVAAPGFPKEDGGQANSFLGGRDLVFTNHHTVEPRYDVHLGTSPICTLYR